MGRKLGEAVLGPETCVWVPGGGGREHWGQGSLGLGAWMGPLEGLEGGVAGTSLGQPQRE